MLCDDRGTPSPTNSVQSERLSSYYVVSGDVNVGFIKDLALRSYRILGNGFRASSNERRLINVASKKLSRLIFLQLLCSCYVNVLRQCSFRWQN